MLRVFESRLIHAHRCKFTQFLLFFLTVQDPGRCCSSFSACLMSLLRDSSQPAITRCACAAYLASFLARCAVAPQPLVVDVLHKLTAASQEYADAALQAAHRHQQQQQQQGFHRVSSGKGSNGLKTSSSDAALVLLAGLNDLMGQGPLNGVAAGSGAAGSSSSGALAAIQRHQVFYAMVQALLYLLCYHMQPLLGSGSSGDQQQQQQRSSEQQQLGQAVATLVRQQVLPLLSHPLAPLAVCHQAVTAEFVRQALLLGLADAEWEAAALDAVSQHQAALAAAASTASAIVIGADGAGGSAGGAQPHVLRPLEVFFPFDPYLLKRSARFLQLASSYTCFSHGHPHASGARRVAKGGDGEEAGVLSDEGDDTTSEDEGDWDEAAAAAASESGSDGSSSSSSESEAEDEPAAAAGGSSRVRRHADGLLPVGLAAAARQQGLSMSGPSPPADMMATSMLSNGLGSYMVGASYESAEHMFGHGGSPMLGGSPMPMSITPYDGSYMQNMQAQLNGFKGTAAGVQ
jgi:RNA polymerase I-specific transcription initiation factor RRN3